MSVFIFVASRHVGSQFSHWRWNSHPLCRKCWVLTMTAVVQSLSCVQFFATPWSEVHQASLSFTISQSSLRLMSIELVMPSNHLILSCLPSPPAFNLSQHQGLFQGVGSSHHVAKVVELQLVASVLPMNIQGWFPLGLTHLISLLSKGVSKVFSSTTIKKHQFFNAQLSFMIQF